MNRRPITIAVLALLLFVVNIEINYPLFGKGSSPYRGSIEAGYAGIAKQFADHPSPWDWNPYVYCGLPNQFTYLPVMPYAVATVLWLIPGTEPLHAYRLVVTLMACLGPVTLFLFAVYATGSERWSLLAALAYTLCSPSYDLFQTVEKDRGLLDIPWRLQVMVKYGEGPHNFGLTLLPLALLGVWSALRSTGYARILWAALGLAAIALTHWIAAFAAAICCLLLILTWVGKPWRLIAAGALAYLLSCFWLTPTFIRTVAFNWPKDAFGYKLLEKQQHALWLIIAGVLVIRLAFLWFPERRYLCFVTMAFFVFAALPESHYDFGIDPIPESRRYAVEMELFLVLAAAEWFRVAWQSRNAVNRFWVVIFAIVFLAKGVPQAYRYTTAGYDKWNLIPKQQTIEYRIADWLAKRQPRGRVYVSGGLRFRLNSWFDLPQINGTFDSGLRNRVPVDLDYRFRTLTGVAPGNETRDTMRILQVLRVEYLVVHGPKSEEYYRDIKMPSRFEKSLTKALDTGGNEVYWAPYLSLAQIIRSEDIAPNWQPQYLDLYVDAITDKSKPQLTVEAPDVNRMRIRGGIIPERALISLAVTFDEGWKASQGGKPVTITRDPLGFMVLHPPSGAPADLELFYGPGSEQMTMAAISGVSWLIAIGAWIQQRRRKSAVDGNPVMVNGI